MPELVLETKYEENGEEKRVDAKGFGAVCLCTSLGLIQCVFADDSSFILIFFVSGARWGKVSSGITLTPYSR